MSSGARTSGAQVSSGAATTGAQASRAHAASVHAAFAAHIKRRSRRRRFCVSIALIVFIVGAIEPATAYLREELDSHRSSIFFEDPLEAFAYSTQKIAELFNISDDDDDLAAGGSAGTGSVDPSFESGSLYSSAALLAELDTGLVLLKKNSELRVYPASLTKIMTALLAAEYLGSLPESITVEPSMFPELYIANASMAGFMPGEEVKTEDLIYGAIVASGAECCLTLATAIAGSEEAFAVMMNERAREIGMTGTHFTNSTGLHDPEHFSTARDIARLLLAALNNEVFKAAFTAVEHTTAPTNMRPDGWLLESDMFSMMTTRDFPGGIVRGGKTGFTPEAGQCMASMAEKNGRLYIFVSTGNGVESQGRTYSIDDALNAYANAVL
jgi:D-alanyl-D-alanine carboxypeptidase (penicillin-binding protein 5/6)